MNLHGWYNNKNQLNLYWTDGYGCDIYDISIDEFDYSETTGPDTQTYHYINDLNYNPGYYFTARVECSENEEYSDFIIVNTKEIDPIEDIIVHVEAGGYDDSLSFSHSSDSTIYAWYFYNFLFDQNDPNTYPHHFTHTHTKYTHTNGTKENMG